jgi:hypothetical protein
MTLFLLPSPPPARSGAPRAVAPAVPPRDLGAHLLLSGRVAPHDMMRALELQRRHGGALSDVLLAQRMIAPEALYAEMAGLHGVALADPLRDPPDVRLIDRLGAGACLRDLLLPLRRAGGVTLVAAARPDTFARAAPALAERFGPVAMVLAPPAAIAAAVTAARGRALAARAETRVAAAESCRDIARRALPLRVAFLVALAGFAAVLAPAAAALVATALAAAAILATTGIKLAAALALRRAAPPAPPPPAIARLPAVSLIVPLFREAGITGRLVRRLERLDYPRELLDVIIVTEAGDRPTQAALAAAGLPPWMRVLVAPPGAVKTKPRALNLALDLCRGSIVGVYDAEDAPAPDQLRKVAARFAARGPEVVCLQGVLDFYNPRANWLARCFTIEYAAWFRIVLPGLARLGLPVPLGGTTLFLRRAALEALGGWDAHNVTEDADLGLRLARRGWRTELIDSVTEEEANCRAWPWVRQRSRWIKGYMMTWVVHMRAPRRLWRDLGPRGFLGVQVLFLAGLVQALLAPLVWTLWLLPLGLPHPAADRLPAAVLGGLVGLFLASEAVNLAVAWDGLRRRRDRLSPLWLPCLQIYFPLAALAAWKALWELATRPFFWDKTAHGLSPGPEPAAAEPAADAAPAGAPAPA